MGRMVVLGATGRTGRLVVGLLRAAGHEVTAHGRRPMPEADRSIVGDLAQPDLRDAVSSADAVLSCLASTNAEAVCGRATEFVLAVPRATPLRYLVISGGSVRRPGERKPLWLGAFAALFRLVEGGMLADREAELVALGASSARWTALRPSLLHDGAATGRWAFTFDQPRRPLVSRADLAAAMVAAIARDDLVGTAPYVA